VEGALVPYKPTGRPPGRPRIKPHVTEANELLLKAQRLSVQADIYRAQAMDLLARHIESESSK
jgi:hypothetical protein